METLPGRMDCSVNPSRFKHTHTHSNRKERKLYQRGNKKVLLLYDFSFAACHPVYLFFLSGNKWSKKPNSFLYCLVSQTFAAIDP